MFPLLPSLLLCRLCFFFLMIRRPPRSTLFPTRRSSDLRQQCGVLDALVNPARPAQHREDPDRKSTRLNSSHQAISYAVFCLKKTKTHQHLSTNKTTKRHDQILEATKPQH